MINKEFCIYRTKAKVVNYDDVSGLYIYKILANGNFGYITKEFVLKNKIF